MLVTRQGDYAVRCALELARAPGEVASARRIAARTLVPPSFLAKILQRLVKARIAASVRGVDGGFRLARNPKDVSLHDVLKAVRGTPSINTCAVEGGRCRMSRACAVHSVWVDIRRDLDARLKSETLAKLLAKR
ncbi:MAG: hypothetical protein A2506_02190 [Elusimicrobia bacterium RIFOXYD12_FULL_66_9]|nr:MAG: hypothetical protein A2506_02190 [Elusimicrobia bacterium RIFOXYD12_FULL_66_9]